MTTIERPAEVCKEIMTGFAIKQSNKTVVIILSTVLPIVMFAAGWLGTMYGKHDEAISANNLKINTLQNESKAIKETTTEIKEAQKKYSKNQNEMMRALRELLKQSKISTDILSDYDARLNTDLNIFEKANKVFQSSSYVCSDP